MRARSALLLLLVGAWHGPAAAGEAEQAAARSVITLQAEALSRDDAPTAYAQAAPAIARSSRARTCSSGWSAPSTNRSTATAASYSAKPGTSANPG